MKKIFIGLLLLAVAAAGVYYILQGKKTESASSLNKELLIGQWKIDSLVSKSKSDSGNLVMTMIESDSNFFRQVYDVKADKQVLISTPADTVAKVDTTSYDWTNENEITWKEKPAEKTIGILKVIRLDSTDMVLQTTDSTMVYLKKVR